MRRRARDRWLLATAGGALVLHGWPATTGQAQPAAAGQAQSAPAWQPVPGQKTPAQSPPAPPAPVGSPPAAATPAAPGSPGENTPEPIPDPAAAKLDHQAGLAKLQAGEVGEAVELLKSAVAKDASSAQLADDLGFALMKLGARREAEALYRRALVLEPRRYLAYANLADLVAASPERWQRRDEILALLAKGQQALRDDVRGRQLLTLVLASFEQRVGRVAEARRHLEVLLNDDPPQAVRKRALDQLKAIVEDERALTLADWPEASLTDQARAELQLAESRLADGRAPEALSRASKLVESYPTNADVRFVRARALDALGRPDEANRELTLLLQLRPSHAGAWRMLGISLATHGGVLAAERADEALARALALEPSWDDLRALRRRVAERRADIRKAPLPRAPRLPSPHAEILYEDAQRWMGSETPDLARAALTEALTDSPGFVDAATSLYALAGEVPATTIAALWDDGEALTRLGSDLLRIRHDAATADLVRGWLDRAIILKFNDAHFQRALLRADDADNEGALADLSAYVASEVSPLRLAEARALRRTLEPSAPGDGATIALARQLLLSDRPREAARALGGQCRPGLSAEVLIELGRVAEYERQVPAAIACHRQALATARTPPGQTLPSPAARLAALERLARLATHIVPQDARDLVNELEQANAAEIPAAAWALARLARADARWDTALELGTAFLATAAPDDPLRGEATSALADWRRVRDEQQRTRNQRLWTFAAAISVLTLTGLTALLARRWRSRTVAAALARAPELFPEVAVAVAEIRHDVLKHRASALGMLGVAVTSRDEIARALREPTPTSAVVTGIYERLRRTAAALGVGLRPLDREPLFGPLVRALGRAEALIDRTGNAVELGEIDRSLRERHGPQLATLLGLCPRTRLDPADLAGWLRGVVLPADSPESSTASPIIVPGLHLPTLDLEVPLPREALYTILANLVRNAIGALAGAPDPRVLLRVEQQRDTTGRRVVTLLVADSAAARISLEQIEQRDGQRGLGIVRDLVRRWGGHLVVRDEAAPFVKAIGVAFPVVSSSVGSP